jgi:hypothetical protein
MAVRDGLGKMTFPVPGRPKNKPSSCRAMKAPVRRASDLSISVIPTIYVPQNTIAASANGRHSSPIFAGLVKQ